MESKHIVSLQIGMPKPVEYQGKTVTTGFFKYPVAGKVRASFTGLDGDGQADLKVHGGREKAIYAFPLDAYDAWKTKRPQDKLEPGIFGENLTINSLREEQTYLGDTYEVGTALLQVAQPRFPCFKLNIRFNDSSAVKDFYNLGRPGVYFRVLREGEFAAGDELKLVDSENEKVSILEIFKFASSSPDFEMIQRALRLKTLTSGFRDKFEKALQKK